MSKRAEEKAVEYQIKTHGPNVMGGTSMLSEEEYMRFNMNLDFKNGYEQAEKATIERAIAWLKEHANDYIVDLTPTYPDAPVNFIVGGKCWDDLKEYLENEQESKRGSVEGLFR